MTGINQFIAAVALLVVACWLPLPAQSEPSLLIEGGSIGQPAADAQGILVFKGIPYAAPPLADLRWRAPQPLQKWAGVRKVTEWGPRCVQSNRLGGLDPLNPRMDEDCLYLNLWAPANAKGLPVMVWIHGGSNLNGAASQPEFDASAWAKQGVVVVSLNYRVDVFGFMAHPELTAESGNHSSGNYGLLDQIAALKWVQRNIAIFGGDPGNVTVLGESAGAINVSLLMASPLAKGLFAKVVGQSGSALIPSGLFSPRTLAAGEQHGLRMATALGAADIRQMRAASAADVLAASAKNPSLIGLGVIDGYVVPAHPASLFESRKANDLPLLLGFNADEGSLFAARSTPPADANAYENLLRSVFKDQAAQALALYPAGENGSSIKPSFTALTGDQIISYGTWAWADKVSRLYQSPVYRYYFNRRPPAAPENSLYPLTGAGVYHFADVLYAFNNLWLRPDWGWQAADHQLAQTMANYWVNFAKTGNPNGPGLPEWPRFTARHQQVMELGAHIGPVSQPNAARYEFLNQFYNHQR